MRLRLASLRARLLALLVTGIAVVWSAVAIASYADARHHVGRLFDAQLEEFSAVLGALAAHEVHEVGPSIATPGDVHAQALSYQVFALDGTLLLRSDEAPAAPLVADDGFGIAHGGGIAWRTLRRVDRVHAFVIIVAQRLAEREALVRDVALRQVLPLASGLPLLALVVWFSVSRAMAPLRRIALEVRGRAPDHLERVEHLDVPAEIEPLVVALNHLFERVERSFESERRFTGDAAHELRTPLAALRTQAEVALTTTHEERRRRALEQVIAGVDRASHLVRQLLALARLDAPQPIEARPLGVEPILQAAAHEHAAQAAARAVAIDVAVEGTPRIAGDAAMLGVLFRNLVDNALRFVPDGGKVRLSAAAAGDEAVVCVDDSGPGVATEMRERIFHRFFRAAGGGGGSGLGLSIARRIVELHHGSIAADRSDTLGGLRMEVRLPLSKL